jgi:uncharacterized DUF497 family protein
MNWTGFDWDSGNWPKCGQHGVAKTTIETIFDRESTKVFRDLAHGNDEEDRYLAIALNVDGHAGLLVGFTRRNGPYGTFVRPITARYMHTKEARRYGSENAK